MYRHFDFWIGRWEGEAVFTPAFQPNAKPRPEKLAAECRAVLSGNYIQCDGTFTRDDGRARGVMWLWNYNEVAGAYEGMTLASNYGQEIPFRIAWDETERAYVGTLPTRTADGRAATERLVFRPSSDRKVIGGLEMLRPDDTPEAIRRRLELYHEQTAPVVERYRLTGKIVPLHAAWSIEAVYAEIQDAIRDYQADRGLKVDGYMRPNGPTIGALNEDRAARQQEQKRAGELQ